MTIFEFEEKYQTRSTPNTNDVLMRVASNLSDLHIEKDFFTPQQMDGKLNAIKEFIFDWQSVLRTEAEYDTQLKEFISHLG
jgi:hypothetical protein